MQRYHEYRDGCEPAADGEWVYWDEAEAELARLRAEVEKLTEQYRLAHFDWCAESVKTLNLEEEVEKLRADVSWAVRHGANASYDGDSHPAVWYEVDSSRMTRWGIPVTSVEYDGTDASLLSAVRRAREGE